VAPIGPLPKGVSMNRIFGSKKSQTTARRQNTAQARLTAATFPLVASLLGMALLQPAPALAQDTSWLPPGSPKFIAKSWLSALGAPWPSRSFTIPGNIGVAPVVPIHELDSDPTGWLGSYNPGLASLPGPTLTEGPKANAFFQSLGTNGRTCATCHQPSSAMSISGDKILARFIASGGDDPLFAPVDGANCPSAVPSGHTRGAYHGGRLGHGHDMMSAYSLILNRGVFRIFMPVPDNAEFTISVVSDPAGCNTDPDYNQVYDPKSGKTTQIVSVYRRPLISANLKFVTTSGINLAFPAPPSDPIDHSPLALEPSGDGFPTAGLYEGGNIMWDGREATLQSQAFDATLDHSQAIPPGPNFTQLVQMVNFEFGFFSAQAYDSKAGDLTANGALGGPINLAALDPVTNGPGGFIALGSPAMNLFDAWSTVTGTSWAQQQQASIYRGQQLFLAPRLNISNVAGLNNIPVPPGPGSCSTCHSQKNDGSDSFPVAQHDIGASGDAVAFGGPAPATDLPIFKVTCNTGLSTPYNGSVVYLNDLGKAMITGKCADIGRTTVPPLRGLAAHAPYFHDGSAKSLLDVINFYDKRFAAGYTAQEKTDLVNFLNAL
jgi:cytochrome c peroxidase